MHDPRPPAGDQPQAIEKLVAGLEAGTKRQVLKGLTGSGKTYVMAKVIERMQRPALIMSPTKVLAQQAYQELKEVFPDNAVDFFVSDYVMFIGESYKPGSDVYIEKSATLDPHLSQLRMATLVDLLTRPDVIVVASISAIFGVGSREGHREALITVAVGEKVDKEQLIARLAQNRYHRNKKALMPGSYRVGRQCIEVFPVSEPHAYRIELQEGVVVRLRKLDGTARDATDDPRCLHIPYSDTFVISRSRMEGGIAAIRAEAAARVRKLKSIGKLLAAQRLQAGVDADTEMMEEDGHCPGMENYLQPLLGYPPGTPPDNLLTFFPPDVLVFFDESHLLVPQFGTQYESDRSRKLPLVEHGYRLPSTIDYRPMRLDEFEERVGQIIYISATPKRYELNRAGDAVVEMLRRPKRSWLDPAIEVVPKAHQMEHLVDEVRQRVAAGEAVLVNTKTKRAAENVAAYLQGHDIRAAWMHDKLKPKDRFSLFDDLRQHRLDVLVGIGLLREGIDLPRVSLVAILDADKPGLFRDETSLLQYVGRAARNPRGRAIFYGNTVTPAMAAVIAETRRRRHKQRQRRR